MDRAYPLSVDPSERRDGRVLLRFSQAEPMGRRVKVIGHLPLSPLVSSSRHMNPRLDNEFRSRKHYFL